MPALAEPEAGPAAGTSNAATAYREIKRRILHNVYAVGATVSVGETASLLEMSRTPVRDALIRLEEERLVRLMPRHGFQVLPISARDMREIYAIVTALEVLAIELLVEREPTAAELAELDAAMAGLEHALGAGDLAAWARCDALFHVTLAALSGSNRLVETLTQLHEQTRRARLITLSLRSAPTLSTRSHRELLAAIHAGDAAQACRLHQEQRRRSGRELTRILQGLDIHHL